MTVFESIILTLFTSFISSAYCQTGNSSSEVICNITIFRDDGTYPGAVSNTWQSKLVDSCPENYTNEEIIRNCEHFSSLNDSLVLELFTPRTNDTTNITYMNRYCGYCNNGIDINLRWGYWVDWREFKTREDHREDPCENYTSKIKASGVNDLDKWTQTFIKDGMILETTGYLRKIECSGKKNWPIQLLDNVVPCVVRNYLYGQDERLTCQYFEKNGRSCNKMKFIIQDYYFFYRDKSYRQLSDVNLTGGDYTIPTENEDIFYMCIKNYQTEYWGKLFRVGISIAFLIAYLVMNFNKKYFEIFSNQLLYVYSIGLIVMLVLLTYIYLKFPVSYVSFYVAKMFWTYHFLWTMLLFIVFCNITFCMCNICKSITEGNTNACYTSILFVFGIVLPISLPIMYLNFLETYETQCPSILGHIAVPDVPSKNLWLLKFVLDPSLAFLMPVIFVSGIFCILSDKCNSDEVTPTTSRRNSPGVLFKMLLIMVIHWGLFKFCTDYYGNENSYTIIGLSINMDMVAQLSIDIHGVIIFFVFLTDNRKINDILVKHGYKLGNTSQQNNNGATETTVRFQS